MKTVKIAAEMTLTPEMFSEWCDGDLPESESVFKRFVEKTLFSKFGCSLDYDDVLGRTVDVRGLKLSVKEVDVPPS